MHMKANSVIILLIVIFGCTKSEIEQEFYPDGKLKFEVPLRGGERHGQSIQYYKNGKIQLISNWENGIKKGESISFYVNGNPHIKATYDSGVANGIIYIYDSLNNLKEKYTVNKESKDGPYQEFYASGKLKAEGKYKNDKPEGEGYEFYETGELFRKYVYKDGELIYFKAYDKQGYLYDCRLPIEFSETKEGLGVSLSYSEFDSARIGIIIGNLDLKNKLIDTLEVLGSKNLSYVYKSNEEINITGVLYEIKMPENRIEGEYYFRYPH